MTYIGVLFAVALFVILMQKYALPGILFKPLGNMAFFNIHYFLFGLILSLVLPDSAAFVFQQHSGTILMFCMMWIGLFLGCGLELRFHQRIHPAILLNNIIEPVIVFMVFFLGGIAYVHLNGNTEGLGPAYYVALFCAFSVFRRHGIHYRDGEHPGHPAMEDLLPIGHVVPVLLLGVGAYLWNDSTNYSLFGTHISGPAGYFVLQLGLGLLAGMMLNMLISGAQSPGAIIAALAGVSAVCGGLAFALSFSPILLGMIAGAFVVNATLKRMQLLDAINTGQAVVEKLFMFFIGTLFAVLPFNGVETIKIALGAATALYVSRILLNYVLADAWMARAPYRVRNKTLLWAGLTGQGILAAGCAFESSIRLPGHTTSFMILIIMLLMNQLTIGAYALKTNVPELLRRRSRV